MATWPLTDEERKQYLAWVLRNNIPLSNDYDMEGFWKESQNPLTSSVSSGINPNDGQVHFSDKYKLPNHYSFSTESKYYDPNTMTNIPSWQGGQIQTPQAELAKALSYTLRKPDGTVVTAEAPWYKDGIKK